MSELETWQWHQEFERQLPEAHHDFLQSLGIEEKEIQHIRLTAREMGTSKK